jgi:hypothetical protein
MWQRIAGRREGDDAPAAGRKVTLSLTVADTRDGIDVSEDRSQMESQRDETDQERVRAVRQPRSDHNAFVCVKDQRMAGVVDEPDEKSNRIDAQSDAEEKWREINRRRRNSRVRRGGLKWKRPNSGEQRGVIAISRSVLPT